MIKIALIEILVVGFAVAGILVCTSILSYRFDKFNHFLSIDMDIIDLVLYV